MRYFLAVELVSYKTYVRTNYRKWIQPQSMHAGLFSPHWSEAETTPNNLSRHHSEAMLGNEEQRSEIASPCCGDWSQLKALEHKTIATLHKIQYNTELVLVKTIGPLLARMDIDKTGAVAHESKSTSPTIPMLLLPIDIANALQVRMMLRMV